jgi:hypothetical protein
MTRLPEMRARLALDARSRTELLFKLAAPLELDDDELQSRYIHVRDALVLLKPRTKWASKQQREDVRKLAADPRCLRRCKAQPR